MTNTISNRDFIPNFSNLKVKDRNTISSYFPIRHKGNDFSWDNVAGQVLSAIVGEQVSQTLEAFEEACRARFLDVGDERLWLMISEAYFRNADIYKLHPRFTLLKGSSGQLKTGATANGRLADIFYELLAGQNYEVRGEDAHNFVEAELYDQISAAKKVSKAAPRPYLPFLSEVFRKDVGFLATKPEVMMAELANVLKFYAFSYCAQLALNLLTWKECPASKPLFFILADEKASSERSHVARYGHKYLRENMLRVFPWLAMSHQLQTNKPEPLWWFYQRVLEKNCADDITILSDFAKKFAKNRELTLENDPPESLSAAFDLLFSLADRQFQDYKFSRHEINGKFVREFEARIMPDFVQVRGRAGKVLVVNQELLLLLTNLVVGFQDRLWFADLVQGFKERGIFFDRQTQTALVAFYERVGNVERKSDSGEAIYVRKTI